MRIVQQKDFAAGLFYIVVGGAFAIGAWGYRMGAPSRMGPGYFPFCLGILMAVIGVVVLLGAIRSNAEPESLERWNLKGLFTVLASVVVFGLLLDPLGLVLSVIVLIAGSSLASREFAWRTTVLNVVVLTAMSLVIFVYGLGLQFPIWPVFMRG